jgi:hypothetical protein
MKHEIWYDAEEKVLRERYIGGFTEEDVPEYLACMKEVYGKSKNCHVIVDLSSATQPFYNRRTRKMLIEGAGQLTYPEEKVAFINAKPDIRMFVKAMVAGMKHMGKRLEAGFFDEESQALAWLKKQGQSQGGGDVSGELS